MKPLGQPDQVAGSDRPSLLKTCSRALAAEDKAAPGSSAEMPAKFDLAAAHDLCNALFGWITSLIRDKKHLIIVPDGPLTGLPFQLLMKEAPSADTTFKTSHWLIRDHAISMLPAVSSLHALRRIPRRTQTASLPFIAFGDPVIGDAPALASCTGYEPDDKRPMEMATLGATRAPQPDEQVYSGGGFTSDGIAIADVEWLRRQRRLPDSRCELEQLARLQGAGSTIHVGEQATEAEVKELSKDGELKKYRVLAFATHGLLPDEAVGQEPMQPRLQLASLDAPRPARRKVAEAGLILTPPAKDKAGPEDDGLLTAKRAKGWIVCRPARGWHHRWDRGAESAQSLR